MLTVHCRNAHLPSGDSIGTGGTLGSGRARLDPTVTSSTAFAALPLTLEPRP